MNIWKERPEATALGYAPRKSSAHEREEGYNLESATFRRNSERKLYKLALQQALEGCIAV